MPTRGDPDPPSSSWRVPEWLEGASGWAWRLLVTAGGVAALLWLMGRLRIVLVPVLVAMLLAALWAPLTGWLVRRRVPRLVSAWITVLLAASMVVVIGWLTVATISGQLLDAERWETVRVEVRTWLRDGPLELSPTDITDLEDRVEDAVAGGFTSVDVGRVRFIGSLLGAGFLGAVLFFFFVKDGRQLWRWGLTRLEPDRRDAVDIAGRAAFEALTAYGRGVVVTGLIDAAAIGLALWLIGVPLVLPLAVLTFFGAFFPIVGATVTGALATLVALVLNGPDDALLVAIAAFVVQQLEGNLIMPLIMRRQVHIHPAAVLVALASGGAVAGIVGAFVAVPIAAMATAAVTALSNRSGIEAESEAMGPAVEDPSS